MTPVRLAVVGCGYVTRALHLPAVAGTPAFRLVGLVDADVSRARHLADEHGAGWVADDHRDALGRVDAVLLAVPNHLHAPMAVEFLRAGAHVLVEKPMATTIAECDRMIESAAESGRALAVGLTRRFYGWTSVVARFVRDRPLGAARRFELIEGERYRQPVQSGFRFDRDQAGGGVLADRGIHVLDLLAWWFGDCEDLEYRDDAAGGVEAECRISAKFAGGISGHVVLTRLRDVPNTHRFEFERGTLVLEDPGSPAPLVRVDACGREWEPAGQRTSAGATAEAWTEVFRRQLADFAGAIREGREPIVSGREGRRSVALLNRCYALRRPLAHPWELGAARL